MSPTDSDPKSSPQNLGILILSVLLALPLGHALLHSLGLRAGLADQVLRGGKPGGDRSYDHLMWKTIERERRPRSAEEREVVLTGSSVIMLNVALPQFREAIARQSTAAPVRVEKLTGGHTTTRDIRLWLQNVPGRKPDVLVFGVYYNTLQPSHRRPDMRYWYPADNATYLRAFYASATVDVRHEWDPDGQEPRLVGEWSRKRWPPDSDRILRPYDAFPNADTEALQELARDCRAEGIRLIMVRTPINPEFLPVYRKARHFREYEEALDATRSEDAEVWNLETCLGEDSSQFADLVHLTPTGRKRFTGILAARLARSLRQAP